MKTGRKHTPSVTPLSFVFIALLVLLVLGFIAASLSLRTCASNAPVEAQQPSQENAVETPVTSISIDLVGDVNLVDGWAIDVATANGEQVSAAFDAELLKHLQDADIFYANHEFTMSSRGEPLNKYYLFRADPARAVYWQQLGVDIVGLANNHAYDYGEEAFLDTLAILDEIDVAYTGAGLTLEEAMTPVYFEIDGYTVAFVAADRSQKWDEVRAADVATGVPGVLFCFDDTLFLEAVATAVETADFVIAIPHWGTEQSTVLEEVQVELAHKLIDIGADAVIGSHPHILQGMEMYQGKLIAYSLGNFWFNWEAVKTMVVTIQITGGEVTYSIIPALQTDQQLVVSDQITAEIIEEMRQLSPTVLISDTGVLSAA